MKYDTTRVYQDIEVNVYASEFEGDESVGIPYGPTCIWAEFNTGDPFELTAEQEKEIAEAATEWALNDDPNLHDFL